MKSRGLFGLLGLFRDYRNFRQRGDTRRDAWAAAVDYWRWDRANWMGWDGLPRDPGLRKLFR